MGCGFNIESDESVIARIESYEPDSSAAEKKVAAFIVSDPARAIDTNVSEMAESSGVSEATVVRFCKRIGYSGFYQMKLQLSHDIGKQSSIAFHQPASGGSSTQEGLAQLSERILGIGQRLEPKIVNLCAAAINNCSVVHVIGCGQSRLLAADIVFRLSGYGIRATGGNDIRIDIANLLLSPREDLCVLISKSGETKKTNLARDIAAERGLTTIAFTAVEKNPLSAGVNFALSADVRPQDARDSNIYLMAIVEAVFAGVQCKLPDSDYLETIIAESRL